MRKATFFAADSSMSKFKEVDFSLWTLFQDSIDVSMGNPIVERGVYVKHLVRWLRCGLINIQMSQQNHLVYAEVDDIPRHHKTGVPIIMIHIPP